jgi:hypothetical protein
MERMIIMNKHELESYILSNWEQEWDDDTRYFTVLPSGSVIGYDFQSEAFYLNSYYNEISYDEAMSLLRLLA